MNTVHTIEFWIGIVFWCIGQNCGLATHNDSFSSKEECIKETVIMEEQIKMDRNRPYIVESRCSPQKIHISIKPPVRYF
jgi:hypothetical protein